MNSILFTHSGTKLPPTGRRDKPRWVPFVIVLAVLITLFVIPVVMLVAAPDRGENTVGVYERVRFEADHDGARVVAGFIAPQGWQRAVTEPDADEGESEPDAAATGEGESVDDAEFTAADNSAWIFADLHTEVASPAQLLREAAPIGAALSPVQALDSGNGLDTFFIEYSLDAGMGISQLITTCDRGVTPSCLLFQVEERGSTHAAGTVMPELAAILKTVEVYS